MIGRLLDEKYEVIRLIGEGGMGAVYEARNTESDSRCAVKVINDEAVAKDDVLIQRFEREAYAAKKVHSPYIVEILDAGHDDETGHPYMVMEMLDGENALQVLKRIGPMPPELALRVGIQTCLGLAKAHEAGVVHRDIKPANLFLSEVDEDERVVKLLDFGVAKFKMDQASESDNESLTRTGSMLGSPMYMSPEQARGLKTIDHRADIWSLGVVLHQLLTGRVPHQDIDGLGELIITICSEPPVLVSENAPWISSEIADVIAGALQLSTSERYQDASAFADALRGCIDGDETIDSGMIVALTDEQKDAPPPEPQEPTPSVRAAAAAAAQGKFVAHDATVALEDVEAEMEKARAALESAVGGDMEDGPDTQTLPVKRGASADPNLAATMALPESFEMPEIPDEAPEAAPAAGSGATAKEATPASEGRKRDEQVLAKHREAQRAAIEAARLGPASVSDSSGSGRMILAIAIGVLIGGGLLAAYYFKTRSPSPAPSNSPTQPAAPAPPPPSDTADASPSTDTEPLTPSAEASGAPSPSASAAAVSGKVKVFPAYAAVQIDNERATVTDGQIVIEGEPGSKHQVRVSANGQSQVVTVSLTERGPVPNVVRAPSPAKPKPTASP